MNFDKQSCEFNFTRLYNATPSGLGATRSNLLRLLRSLDLVSWSTHEDSGRLDRKAFTRFAVGSTSVFARRSVGEAEKSAVSILIDCSGSMSGGNRLGIAQQVTIQLARLLDKARAEFVINGFSGDQHREALKVSGANENTTERYKVEDVKFIPFKLWNESLVKAAAKLGALHHCASGSTPDYTAISTKLEELARREEHRKVFFLLTDASGYAVEHMKHLQAFADKQGIKLVAIGIGQTEVDQCFRSSVNVESADDLAAASFGKLLAELR